MRTFITGKKQKNKKAGRQAAVCLFWLAAWQAAALAVGKPLILPGPWDTLTALAALIAESEFYFNVLWTLLRCAMALVISFVLGCACAWGAYRAPAFRAVLTLPVGFFKAVPVMAIVIYVILIAAADWVAVIVCFLMCFPIVYTNVLTGFDGISEEYLELAEIYDLSSAEKLRYIYWPGAAAQVEAAVRLIAGMSWKAVVAAEVLSIPKYSLGYEMLNAKYYLRTPDLFAYIAVIVILSLAAEKGVEVFLERSGSKSYEGSHIAVRSRRAVCDAPPREVKFMSVSKTFGEKTVLSDTWAVLRPGKTNILMGPSGKGKTTFARLLTGLDDPDSGEICFYGPDGRPCERPEIAYLFQEDRLLPWLNVYDNMALALIRSGKPAGEDPVMEMAKSLELEDSLWKLPEELSGGMKHRAALGRTFLSLEAGAGLAVFDEPFRGLDSDLRKRIIDRLWKRCAAGRTVLLITHDEDNRSLGENMIELEDNDQEAKDVLPSRMRGEPLS